MKFAFIKANSSNHSVKKMCQILNASRSGYDSWKDRPITNRRKSDMELLAAIRKLFDESRQTAGSPKIHEALRAMGYRVGANRVARIMRENGLKSVVKKKFRVVTTDSKHNLPIAPNLLNRQFKVDAPNKVWASDLTYIQVADRFAYLCIIKDLFNHEPIGWSLAYHMRTEMVIDALNRAVQRRRPKSGLMFHSDRGSQYASKEFRKELKQHKMIQSMSRKGNCWDNAPVESFFKSLKLEEVYRKKYSSLKDARENLFEYIEVFYIRKRRHASLGYMTPAEFLKRSAS